MDAQEWDARYDTSDYVWRSEPNVFLAAEVRDLAAGTALDLACGEGRNAVWLAERGWTVTGVDFSKVGLDKGRRLAESRGVDVDWVEADARSWDVPLDAFDLVALLYLQLPAVDRRQALGVAARGLAPGGVLVVVGHDARNLAEGVGGPQDPSVLFTPEDVLTDLGADGRPDLLVERAETVERTVDGSSRPALDCLVRVRRQPG